MANENDQQNHHHQQHNQSSSSTSSHHTTASDLQVDCEKGDATTMKSKKDTDNDGGDHKEENKENELYYNNNEPEFEEEEQQIAPTAAKGKLNDLVADLCLNGHRSAQSKRQTGVISGYGDYTKSRPASKGEGFSQQSSLDNSKGDNSFSVTSTAQNVVQPPTQNSSSFSFKHFLSSSSAPTAPSTTVTSLDPPGTNHSTSTTSSVSSSAISSRSMQTSTGARPKVPQSNSVTSTSISSLVGGGSGLTASSSVGDGQSANSTKMKRSPRFSSFDSQASLAEYAGASTTADLPGGEASSGVSRSSDYRLYAAGDERDRFADWNMPSNSSTITTNSSDYDRAQYVPRSYSNYEMPKPQTSPRRRANLGINRESRPTRLALNTNSNQKMAAKLKLDLPLNQNNSSGASSSSSVGGGGATSRKKGISSRSSDFQATNNQPGAAAASALPDFVQDHWMDSWYANDMHVNSPPSSPVAAFAVDIPGASGDQAAGGIHRTRHADNIPLPGPDEICDAFQMGLPEQPSSSVGSKMLPDFLSDGPIIHSSQRLADIATGLPSTSVGSPEESSITNQLTRLRSENEILQSELNETRAALNEQTTRANNLERQLVEQQMQYKTEVEETSDTNMKNSAAVQTQVLKLKAQVQLLTAELDILRREKELMREEGAVGGSGVTNCDRSPFAASGAGAAASAVSSSTRCSAGGAAASAGGYRMSMASGSGGCVGVSSSTSSGAAASLGGGVISGAGLGIRPSRAQQISRDLRMAASNAEQNLRQLLAGVDNLRLMASNIEKPDNHLDYDVSPDLFSEFLDDCDEYDEYPGGPAL